MGVKELLEDKVVWNHINKDNCGCPECVLGIPNYKEIYKEIYDKTRSKVLANPNYLNTDDRLLSNQEKALICCYIASKKHIEITIIIQDVTDIESEKYSEIGEWLYNNRSDADILSLLYVANHINSLRFKSGFDIDEFLNN